MFVDEAHHIVATSWRKFSDRFPRHQLVQFTATPVSYTHLLETAEFNDALSYVKTLKAKGGKPIPADENSLDALVDKKFDTARRVSFTS